MEQFPALSAVIQSSQIEPKEKELEVIEKEIAKLDGVSKADLEKQKLALEKEISELKKRVEQFPALSAVIQSSQIEPKEKKLEARKRNRHTRRALEGFVRRQVLATRTFAKFR